MLNLKGHLKGVSAHDNASTKLPRALPGWNVLRFQTSLQN